LGTHFDSYKGQEEKKVRKIFFVFEVEAPGKDGGDRRFFVGREFNLSYMDGGLSMPGKSKVREFMEAWNGRPFADDEVPDFAKALAKPCLANVTHEASGTRTFAKLASVSKPVKGMAGITPTRPPFAYVVTSNDPLPGAADSEKSEWLPRVFGERVHTIIGRSLEKGGTGRKLASRPLTENGEPAATAEAFPHGASAPTVEEQAEEVF
jgi:hypothetical protein